MQSAFFIFGTISLNESFWMQDFPYRQALQPRHPFTSFFRSEISSVLCPASSAPLIKYSTSCAVFPFGLPPPCMISMFSYVLSPFYLYRHCFFFKILYLILPQYRFRNPRPSSGKIHQAYDRPIAFLLLSQIRGWQKPTARQRADHRLLYAPVCLK